MWNSSAWPLYCSVKPPNVEQGAEHSAAASLAFVDGEVLCPNPGDGSTAGTWAPGGRSHHSESSSISKEKWQNSGQLRQLGSALVQTVGSLVAKDADVHR